METAIGGVVVGAAVGYFVPAILTGMMTGLGSIFRPVAKELVKAGIVAWDYVSETVAEAGEQVSDLMAEARSELSESSEPDGDSASGNGKPGE